jgi:hypothetical protein
MDIDGGMPFSIVASSSAVRIGFAQIWTVQNYLYVNERW